MNICFYLKDAWILEIKYSEHSRRFNREISCCYTFLDTIAETLDILQDVFSCPHDSENHLVVFQHWVQASVCAHQSFICGIIVVQPQSSMIGAFQLCHYLWWVSTSLAVVFLFCPASLSRETAERWSLASWLLVRDFGDFVSPSLFCFSLSFKYTRSRGALIFFFQHVRQPCSFSSIGVLCSPIVLRRNLSFVGHSDTKQRLADTLTAPAPAPAPAPDDSLSLLWKSTYVLVRDKSQFPSIPHYLLKLGNWTQSLPHEKAGHALDTQREERMPSVTAAALVATQWNLIKNRFWKIQIK